MENQFKVYGPFLIDRGVIYNMTEVEKSKRLVQVGTPDAHIVTLCNSYLQNKETIPSLSDITNLRAVMEEALRSQSRGCLPNMHEKVKHLYKVLVLSMLGKEGVTSKIVSGYLVLTFNDEYEIMIQFRNSIPQDGSWDMQNREYEGCVFKDELIHSTLDSDNIRSGLSDVNLDVLFNLSNPVELLRVNSSMCSFINKGVLEPSVFNTFERIDSNGSNWNYFKNSTLYRYYDSLINNSYFDLNSLYKALESLIQRLPDAIERVLPEGGWDIQYLYPTVIKMLNSTYEINTGNKPGHTRERVIELLNLAVFSRVRRADFKYLNEDSLDTSHRETYLRFLYEKHGLFSHVFSSVELVKSVNQLPNLEQEEDRVKGGSYITSSLAMNKLVNIVDQGDLESLFTIFKVELHRASHKYNSTRVRLNMVPMNSLAKKIGLSRGEFLESLNNRNRLEFINREDFESKEFKSDKVTQKI